ncbi:MAG: hypothetical protein RL518_788 [Pseudomonadota bacterium]|jgi:hypothetical protein
MSHIVRIDTHAHLYDTYSVRNWCHAAFRNLRGGEGISPIVIVVDREGQDSLSRLRREVPSFAQWHDLWGGLAGVVSLERGALVVVQGVQYVTKERLEVLGLGVGRVAADGDLAVEYISRVTELDGLACLPWSPGKWLGSRGRVVRELLDTVPVTALCVGDISMRTRFGPPSMLMHDARRKGFPVLLGTDPLAPKTEEELVGGLGVEFVLQRSPEDLLSSWSGLRGLLGSGDGKEWGCRNSVAHAARRFLSSVT